MNLHYADDTCSQKGDSVSGQTERLENGRCIVKDSIDTRPLLEEHCPEKYVSFAGMGCRAKPTDNVPTAVRKSRAGIKQHEKTDTRG